MCIQSSAFIMNEFSYDDIFRLEEGETIIHTAVATYSLDIGMVPLLAMYTQNKIAYSDGFRQYANIQCVRKAVSDVLYSKDKRLDIFFQRNCLTNNSAGDTDIARAVLDYEGMHPVDPPTGDTCFHPKIICMEIENGGRRYCRMAVSTRNLTLSDSVESVVVLQSNDYRSDDRCLSAALVPDTDKNNYELFERFAEFIEELEWRVLEQDAGGNLIPGEKADVFIQRPGGTKIIDEMGIDNIHKAAIISPGFYENALLKTLRNKKAALIKYNAFKEPGSFRQVHEKIYLFRKDTGCELWTGSSNCSVNGLGDSVKGVKKENNIECMVRTELSPEQFTEFSDYFKENYADAYYADDGEDDDFMEKAGELIAFINNTDIILELEKSGEDYGVKIIFESKKNNGKNIIDRWGDYYRKIRVENSFGNFEFEEREPDGDSSFSVSGVLSAGDISDSIMLSMESKNGIVKRIVYPDVLKNDSRELLEEIRGKEHDRAVRELAGAVDFFPKRITPASSGAEDSDTEKSSVSTGSYSYPVSYGDYEKLFRMLADGELDDVYTEQYLEIFSGVSDYAGTFTDFARDMRERSRKL